MGKDEVNGGGDERYYVRFLSLSGTQLSLHESLTKSIRYEYSQLVSSSV